MSRASAEVITISDGSWYVITRAGHAPHPRGRGIKVEGVRVYVCPRCERKADA